MLEGKFADLTGEMPISLWSTNIEPVRKAGDKCFVLKNAVIKLRNEKLTITTNSNTEIIASNADKKLKDIYCTMKKTPLKPTDTIKGSVKFVKDFTCGSKCLNCSRMVPHPLTSSKFKCPPCNAIQPSNGMAKVVTLSINDQKSVPNSNIRNYTPFDEESLSDYLFGKFLEVTFFTDSKEITSIKPVEPNDENTVVAKSTGMKNLKQK